MARNEPVFHARKGRGREGLALFSAVFLVVFALTACATSKPAGSKAERARLVMEIGNAALIEGDPIGALQSFRQAELIDPDLPDLHHSMALAFLVKHDQVSALKEAREAVALRPDYSDANNTLGKLLIDAGKSDQAIAPLERAAKDPVYREAFKPLTNLGILYYRRGEYGRAKEYFDQAVAASPLRACIAHYYRGHIDLREAKFRDAVRDYDEATQKVCAGFEDAHLALGIAYERSGQYDQARKKFLEIQQRFPDTHIAEQAISHLRKLP